MLKLNKSSFAVLAALSIVATQMAAAPMAVASGSNTGTSTASNGATFVSSGVGKIKQFMNPDQYIGKTCKIHLRKVEDLTPVSAHVGCFGIPDKGRVAFAPTVEKRSVPHTWQTWGSPPDTEGARPNLLYTAGATSVTISFDEPMTIVGMEVEPNPFERHTFQLEFFNNGESLGIITRDAEGTETEGGARLLAGQASGITSVVVSCDVDFGFARLRLAR